MSFARELENNPKNSDKDHVPGNQMTEVHAHSNGWKSSHQLVFPPMNHYGGRIRTKPKSGFNQASLISNNGQVDFEIGSAGYVEKLILELEFTAANPVTVLPHYLIDRIEFLSTEGNIMSTVYGDNVYAVKLNKTLEQHNREKSAENLDSSYNGVSVAASTLKRINLHIPCFIDGTQIKLSAVHNKMIARFYFSPNGVTAGAASDISVSLCDVIQITQQLSGALEALEQKRKSHGLFKFRFLNPVRIASQTLAMTASSQYDIRLTSANGLYAYLFFVIRTNPISSANVNSFLAIDSFELLDQDNTIVGIKTTNEMHKYDSLMFNGDVINFKNFYVIPFALSIEAANNGGQVGFYKFNTNEILRLYTPAGFANTSYRVDVYGYEYNTLTVTNGVINVKK